MGNMTAVEVIEKSREFMTEFTNKLNDPNEQSASKQVYFMDNHETVQKYMVALKKVIDAIKIKKEEEITPDELEMLSDAEQIVREFKLSISEFQKTLAIPENIKEEDTQTQLTNDTLQDAMQNNRTTQKIMQDMQSITQSQAVPYNYAMICDGKMNLISANDKGILNKSINDIAGKGNYKDIQLYKIQFTPVPLKVRTVLIA